ncbi:PKD domain-containing protein [Hymenobacter sp. NST-14]|uniref:GEVED domain-containing protein n=1 Tax=Hymenobacter piscis TaxID=2839984 RepID=UPI001C00F4D4|nr:GEVED domain-containing protein [Hymenobacter piscis]MBT9393783.1 PKD domain-containing protein [Hymenobacter piscis]
MPLPIPRLRGGKTGFAPALLALALPLFPLLARAQTCPPAAASCTPGNAPAATSAFGMGIFNVTLGGLNHTTDGAQDGYKDYACSQTATLAVGTDVPISIQTNPNADETVRVWADLNNDGAFAATELVFSSNARRLHTGTVRLPASTVTGLRLRLRVAADYSNAPVPTACSTPQYSQTEDYALLVTSSAQAPVADFQATPTQTCSGVVQFTDQSQNGPSSWQWNFGDGTTSTLQNPRHTYAAAGTYTVSLTATNTVGSSTKARPSYISYDNLVPVAAACTPATTAYCCGYGITQFTLGSFTNASANGQAGYEDFTCSGKSEVTAGNQYPVRLTTGPANPQDTRVWLDANNDGVFAAGELLFEALNTINPSGTLQIPATALLDTPLRLRVVSDFVGSPFTACGGIQYGQAEDYTLTVRVNVAPPTPEFTSDYVAGSCQTSIRFSDLSQNGPSSWRWDFGDGTTSTLQNPSHTYAATGTYTVSLAATNAYGTTTSTRPGYVVVTVPCLQYCAAAGNNAGFWITNVRLETPQTTAFSNTSGADPRGYGNYAGQLMTMRQGQNSTLQVTTNAAYQRVTSVWIDWNRDGFLASSELVSNDLSYTQTSIVVAVPTTADVTGITRMRIMARLDNNTAQPCTGSQLRNNTEIEDYSVLVVPLTAARAARNLPALAVFPNPTADGLLRLTEPGTPDTYAVEVESPLGARLYQGQLRLGSGLEAGLDLSHLPRGLYVLRLRGTRGQSAVRRLVRD